MSSMALKLPKIGIIGGGQLGRMFLQNSMRYGHQVFILESEPDSPAGRITHNYVKGHIKDANAILQLAEQSDVLTYEIEHINSDVLLELESKGKKIIPFVSVLKTIQDKGLQKLFYQKNEIPTAPFQLVKKRAEWLDAMTVLGGEKFAVKSRTGGYDGKGVFLTDLQSIRNGVENVAFDGEVVIEKLIDCQKELAVMVAVGQDGQIAVYPVVDMEFHPVSNLVTYLFTPADISENIENQVKQLAVKTVKAFQSPGLFAVEFFLDKEQNIWVNEIAPRPHNSAHHTIEGSYTSQFDQLYRILTGLPLGDTDFKQAAVMLNIVGPEGGHGEYVLKNLDKILSIKGVYIHMYGKNTSSPHRKLGHVTIVDDDIEIAKQKAQQVESLLKIQLI